MVLTLNNSEKRNIYVVVSDSGSRISKILRLFTKAKYNHVSISLEEDLSEMYSFGRRWKYYAFYGGFVKETPYTGVFGLFPDAKIVVLPFAVTEAQYDAICLHIKDMYAQRKRYGYSWLGIFAGLFGKKLKRKHHYICSGFVEEVLTKFGVVSEEELACVLAPNDFLHKFGERKIYEGRYRDYAIIPKEEKQAV